MQSSAENWSIKSNGDGTHTIQSGDGKALAVSDGKAENGANLNQWEYWGGDGQQNFILGNGTLTDWKAGDLCENERIDVFDMVIKSYVCAGVR